MLTKHIHDETLAKLPLSLEDVEANVNILESSALGLCGGHVGTAKSFHAVAPETTMVKSTLSRAKIVSAKSRLVRALHKLYDLEFDSTPEKTLNVDLRADLYQMENY